MFFWNANWIYNKLVIQNFNWEFADVIPNKSAICIFKTNT